MATKSRPSFDTKFLLSMVGEGSSIGEYIRTRASSRREILRIRSFTSREARRKSPSFRSKARKPSSQCLERTIFSGKDVWLGRRNA